MMAGVSDRLGQQWRRIPPARRMALKSACWGFALVVVWQGLWLPGKQRVDQAAAQLYQERVLSQRLLQLSGTWAAEQKPGPALSVARLSERAQAGNLQIVDLQSNDQQVAMTVQGRPQALMRWIEALEQDGAQLSEIRLQAIDDQLQASIGLALDDG
ncbi:type II secretion system protein GspM [Pseudomonas sp. NPDC089428]|uniref:type II secretion system protein GspM n=1 Tax=Pseudomonas sp. NPDC089428 TaxID=3364467 RepID=UPI0037F84E9A